jgi:DNA polymerase-3 subunit chi
MTDIRFYHLQAMPLDRALPKLVEKVLASGARAVIVLGSEERVAQIDGALWTFDPNSFLPHGTARDGRAEDQPAWITVQDENPNGARVLILADGAASSHVSEFEKCLDVFDGNDADAVAAARERWRNYKGSVHQVTYWKQDDSGRWHQASD